MTCADCSIRIIPCATGRPPQRCPDCAKARHREQIKQWKRDNRDHINKRSAVYRENNRERLRKYNRERIRLSRLKKKVKVFLED